ncbi:MAG: OmpA family protein [Bacteroidetes bacterium]|nr:OmpA family protein [Bacteroidota bacterium]
MKKILTIVAAVCMPVLVFSQDVSFDEKNFPGKDKKEIKEARRNFDDGNSVFEQAMAVQNSVLKRFVSENHYYPNGINELAGAGAEGFIMARDAYLKANAFNPNNAQLNFRLGVCYYNIPKQKMMALAYLEKAQKLNPNVDADLQYYLGRAYHLTAQWDKAITAYRAWQQPLNAKPTDNRDKIADANRKIGECLNGKEYEKNPVRVFIDNLGNAVNSSDAEYTPIITADEATMIFTSRRPGTTGGKRDEDNQYFEDLYLTTWTSSGWSTPVNMGKPVNSEDHDATAGLSPDGQRMYIYRPRNGGDLYESILTGTLWSEPERMNKNINSEGHESSVSVSFDGKKLYFVSDREGTLGNRDIWVSTMDAKGRWGESQNLGPGINTMYGEEGVFMHPDGKTMYFSSQGHKSMGGYDIFKCEWKDGKWSEPENLGWPINGPDDDVFFVVSGNGRRGYFSSNKADGLGEKDIYKITFLGPEKPLALSSEDNLIAGNNVPVKTITAAQQVEIKTAQLTLLKGTITDAMTQKPVGATIELVDNERQQVIATFPVNSSTGKYLVSLPSGKNYGIAVKAEGYLFHSENFDIPAIASYQEVQKDIALKPVAVGSAIVLRNVFFDVGKATLRPESFTELDRLVALLNDVPTMRIEVSGHTDNRGSAEMNKKLSQDRAKAVADYLISKGIKAERIVWAGYGFDQPMASNDTEANRQLNRRTEFKILSR